MWFGDARARKAMPPIQKAAHRQQTYEGTLEMLQGPEKKEGLKGPLCGGLKQTSVCQICRGGRWSHSPSSSQFASEKEPIPQIILVLSGHQARKGDAMLSPVNKSTFPRLPRMT